MWMELDDHFNSYLLKLFLEVSISKKEIAEEQILYIENPIKELFSKKIEI